MLYFYNKIVHQNVSGKKKTKNTQTNSNLHFIVNLKTTTLISEQQNNEKSQKPSQRKPTNKAAARLKPSNFTIQRTKLQHKRQTKLKHKEVNSKA